MLKFAGGACDLADDSPGKRQYVLENIRLSVTLHGSKEVDLMMHRDCGAHGGSHAFESHVNEGDICKHKLLIARKYVEENIPGVRVRCFFVEFSGIGELSASEHILKNLHLAPTASAVA